MNPIAALERYALFAVIVALALAGAYFKGMHDKGAELAKEQLAANADALGKANAALIARADTDEKARLAGQQFIDSVNAGLAHAQATFGKMVVVDPRGCAALAPDFGLRWNAVASLPGTLGQGAGDAHEAVPGDAVQAAGGPDQPPR